MHDYSLFDDFDSEGWKYGIYPTEVHRWIGGESRVVCTADKPPHKPLCSNPRRVALMDVGCAL